MLYVWKLFDKLKNGLSKTKSSFTDKITEVLKFTVTIDDDMYESWKSYLLQLILVWTLQWKQ